MTPPTFDDARRQLWHLRKSTAQWVAPSGLNVTPPLQIPAPTENAGEDALAAEEACRVLEQRETAMANSAHARSKGTPGEAAEHLRHFLLDFPSDSRAWHLYALRLIESRNYGAAFEALKNAMTADPANLDALELLVDAAAGDSTRSVTVHEAFDKLVVALPERPEQHRRALDFAVPARLDGALATLAQSPDRITRAVVEQALDLDQTMDYPKPSWLSEDEYLLAKLLFSLQRGRRTSAIELMGRLPERAIPRWSLRLAIRRDLRANRLPMARKLLTEYVRLAPEDGWANAQEAKLRKTAIPTNYQLTKQGFPFPYRRAESAYEPVSDRVFYLLHNSLPYHSAGYSTRTHGLLSGLRDQNWDVRGVTRLGYPFDMPKMDELGPIGATDVVDGVSYHRLSTTPGIQKKSPITTYVGRYVMALEAHAREELPALIHGASNHWNGLAAVSAANRLGLPSVYEVRGLWEVTRGSRDPAWAEGGMYRFMARMEADAAANATHVLAITRALKDELINRGVDGGKITVVPNAVDTDRFTPQKRDAQLETELGLRGRTVIGYVGSILDYEGLELLIVAADKLRAERDDFAVLIVGDGAEYEKFQVQAADLGLEKIVRFTGRVPHEDVERYYSLVDITPFPRLPLPVCEMVSPLKPFEALAMGKAVVASDVAALAEIIRPGVNGLLHRKGDVEDLTRQLRALMDDATLRENLSRKGRNWVVENRQWAHMSGIVSDVYERLGAQRTS